VEFTDAFAWRVGDEGAGIRTIIQMVQLTRLDCAAASAGLMRMALVQAVHHCRYRNVFGKHLIEQPMMRAVLADMALDIEAAVALVVRLSRALDHAATDPREAAYARLITPAAKFWTCKLAPGFIFEAMESLGGNGYVEESILPRLYREGPVNAIWEGSGNVMCLDVLRALKGKDETELLTGLARDAGVSVDAEFSQSASEAEARRLVLRLALLASSAALKECAPSVIADTFFKTRVEKTHAAFYGAAGLDSRTVDVLLQRVLPET
jgi:putative acyl-CoA dehydrogenase